MKKRLILIITAGLLLVAAVMAAVYIAKVVKGDQIDGVLVETAYSMSHRYFSQVYITDEGTENAKTVVAVYDTEEKSRLPFIKTEPEPRIIYTGEGDEYIEIMVSWTYDETLKINNKEYVIEKENNNE